MKTVKIIASGGIVALLLTAGATPALAYTNSNSGSNPAALGTLTASFNDTWSGTGVSSWTFTTMRSSLKYTATKSGPLADYTLTISETVCANKYGFGDISWDGVGVTQQEDCFTDSTPGPENRSSITNNLDGIKARGNKYGRWLWVSHRVLGKMNVYGDAYNAEAYHRSSPVGGSI